MVFSKLQVHSVHAGTSNTLDGYLVFGGEGGGLILWFGNLKVFVNVILEC